MTIIIVFWPIKSLVLKFIHLNNIKKLSKIENLILQINNLQLIPLPIMESTLINTIKLFKMELLSINLKILFPIKEL